MPNHTLIMLGSGPGIGVGVASHFAAQHFTHIALVSRNAERLATDVASVEEAGKPGVVVKAFPADVGDTKSLEATLNKIVDEFGKPEVVVFNAARLRASKLFDLEEESIDGDFRIATLGLYTTARVLIPHLLSLTSSATHKPTLLVTSGGLYKNPYHAFFSLGLAKAAQHNLTMSLSQRYAKEGVHVAAIVVHGLVKPESEIFSPKKIAETYWRVYEQGKEGEREVWITDGKGWQPAL